jgi:hypothetical protein
LNGSGFVIFGDHVNILGISKVKLVDSPIVDTRLIHDYPAFVQKIRHRCPNVALESLMMAIFIYVEVDQPSLQRHHCLVLKMRFMVVYGDTLETYNGPKALPKKPRRGGKQGD